MAALNPPLRLGVLISGGGTNLQAVLDAIEGGRVRAEVVLVVSNVSTAFGLTRARERGIATAVVKGSAFPERRDFDRELVRLLRDAQVDLVVLAGFMRIVTTELLSAFPTRVVNVHPALLPAFPGKDAQDQAFDYGARIAGCTVHFVDEGTDTGPIIAQAVVPVLQNDTKESLRTRILAKEHELLPKVIGWIADGQVSVDASAARPRVIVRDADTAFGLA